MLVELQRLWQVVSGKIWSSVRANELQKGMKGKPAGLSAVPAPSSDTFCSHSTYTFASLEMQYYFLQLCKLQASDNLELPPPWGTHRGV